MPPYTIENTPTRRKLSQAVVPAISTRRGIAGRGFYHFPPAHNRPLKTMSEVKVNQWHELSQFLFRERRFTKPIATNGELLEGFMFLIGWPKCSTKNKQFGLYGSLGKIENAKDEWRNRGVDLSSVGCILVNCGANIPANQGAFKFASALTFTMNGFKNSPHLDKDALLYASG
ncbi:hypothetical protein O181_078708 [Austropuccinia psidii MF-1]|uniref:Tet-like 2OG-Fe(II) oxygenase domain-containing protein n=1 Tax=Austropuccinia psidii MF-1 TaxID=1389203 RepID=A0A9Q3FJH0_9BASI|nr:hypothetical protein [Austropuccinia psidii MF-1]